MLADQQNILKLPSLPNEEDEIMKTATDGENSGNMLNSESSVDLSKETQSVSDNCRKLMISGILPSTTNDELELYFESHKKSGGGDIELVERVNEESAIITFEDSSGKYFLKFISDRNCLVKSS